MGQKIKTPLRINVRKCTNSASRVFGMWFPEVDRVGTLSTRALCDHIAAHGSIWTRDIVTYSSFCRLKPLSKCYSHWYFD